jgi:hypothetical protein
MILHMKCLSCNEPMQIAGYHCPACGIRVDGEFRQPRLARLSEEQLQFAERFILAGGNLKVLAHETGVSYPTVRKRVDRLVEALREQRALDQAEIDRLLDQVERRQRTPEHVARLIREMNGDA